MTDAFIIDAVRTPGGSESKERVRCRIFKPYDLGATLLIPLKQRNHVIIERVDAWLPHLLVGSIK